MTTPATRIIIRHLSGSKANQIEQFDLDGLQEISFGRDPANKVAYDFQRDDEVSRRHAVIRVKTDKDVYFRIADLNSSNGTFLNGERIAAEVEILPEDVVELGATGPKFSFDVQPRPANMPARTRSMTAMGAIEAAATRVVGAVAQSGATMETAAANTTGQRSAVAETASPQAKVAVGKLTIQRMLFEERRSAGRIWGAALAVVLVLAVGGGYLVYRHGQNNAADLEKQVAEQADLNKNFRNDTNNQLKGQQGLTAADIKRIGDATVYIENVWQLYDWQTNRPVYQRMVKIDGEWLPCYVKMDDNRIVRWLTLEQNKDDAYKTVGKRQSGSGFVVGEQGFILTNKHVASGWGSRYEDFRLYDWHDGAVYPLNGKLRDRTTQQVNNLSSLTNWVPEGGGYVFEAGTPRPISDNLRRLYGRNEVLTVQFPGTRIEFNATLLRTSIEVDIAEVKVDTPQALTKLPLADDGSVSIGDKITLFGYPDVSQGTIAVQQSNEGGVIRNRSINIPEPTVTQGIVSKMPTKKEKRDEGGVTTFNTIGDMYQLDIFAGPGSSGGPVVNAAGQVIALLSLGSASAEHVSFAVPVSYVRELMQPQRKAEPQHDAGSP
jgi:S1-C subfamily serine protease